MWLARKASTGRCDVAEHDGVTCGVRKILGAGRQMASKDGEPLLEVFERFFCCMNLENILGEKVVKQIGSRLYLRECL